jgi:hypothetical protein
MSKWTKERREAQSRKLRAYYASPEAKLAASVRAKRAAKSRKKNRAARAMPVPTVHAELEHVARVPAQELLLAERIGGAATEVEALAELIVAVHAIRSRR